MAMAAPGGGPRAAAPRQRIRAAGLGGARPRRQIRVAGLGARPQRRIRAAGPRSTGGRRRSAPPGSGPRATALGEVMGLAADWWGRWIFLCFNKNFVYCSGIINLC